MHVHSVIICCSSHIPNGKDGSEKTGYVKAEFQKINSRNIGKTLANFNNILQAAFARIFFCQKITKPNLEKSFAKHFCTKKVLVKCWWNWLLITQGQIKWNQISNRKFSLSEPMNSYVLLILFNFFSLFSVWWSNLFHQVWIMELFWSSGRFS